MRIDSLKTSLIVSSLLALSATAFAQTPPPAPKHDDKGMHGKGMHSKEHGRHGPRKLDTNKDGKISREEAAQHPHLAQNFDQLDTNKDGALSKDELRAGHKRHHQSGHSTKD